MAGNKGKRSAGSWILIAGEILIVLMVVRWFLTEGRESPTPSEAPPARAVQPD